LMNRVFETERALRLDAAFAALEAALPYYTDPVALQRSPKYRQQPERNWLGALLTGAAQVRYLLNLRSPGAPAAESEARRFAQLVAAARTATDHHLPWVREQLQRELTALVRHYHRADWVEAVREGMPHEFWFVLNERSAIQAHLDAGEILHPGLMPDPELVRQVRDTDALLKEIGPALWAVDPPTGWPPEQRVLYYSREKWWWWLDQTP
jgi:hypothetical protein